MNKHTQGQSPHKKRNRCWKCFHYAPKLSNCPNCGSEPNWAHKEAPHA